MIGRTRAVRCYNCGLDYRSSQQGVCPRCGESRIVRFTSAGGTPWIIGLELAGATAMLIVVVLRGAGRL